MKTKLLFLLFALLFVSVVNAQENGQISANIGYVPARSEMGNGMNIELSYDHLLKDGLHYWFGGLGVNYYGTDLCSLEGNEKTNVNVGMDMYALCLRGGWIIPIGEKFMAKGVVESGVGYMQSHHIYDGLRYRTSNPTTIFGMGLSGIYNINRCMGLSLDCKFLRFGNDNLQRGNDNASSSEPLQICPITYGLGLVVKF